MKNWERKVKVLPQDCTEYIDWSFFGFEATNVRSDILIKTFDKELTK